MEETKSSHHLAGRDVEVAGDFGQLQSAVQSARVLHAIRERFPESGRKRNRKKMKQYPSTLLDGRSHKLGTALWSRPKKMINQETHLEGMSPKRRWYPDFQSSCWIECDWRRRRRLSRCAASK